MLAKDMGVGAAAAKDAMVKLPTHKIVYCIAIGMRIQRDCFERNSGWSSMTKMTKITSTHGTFRSKKTKIYFIIHERNEFHCKNE